MIFGGSILLALSLLAWAFSPSLVVLLVVLIPLALASGVLRVAINTALTRSVWPEEVGGTLGLSASLNSLARVVSPTVGGFLLGQVGPAAPGVLGALLLAWLVYYAWRRILFVPALACPAGVGERRKVCTCSDPPCCCCCTTVRPTATPCWTGWPISAWGTCIRASSIGL